MPAASPPPSIPGCPCRPTSCHPQPMLLLPCPALLPRAGPSRAGRPAPRYLRGARWPRNGARWWEPRERGGARGCPQGHGSPTSGHQDCPRGPGRWGAAASAATRLAGGVPGGGAQRPGATWWAREPAEVSRPGPRTRGEFKGPASVAPPCPALSPGR
jgi:hypothetical protein